MYPQKNYYAHKIIYLLVLLFRDLSILLFTLLFLYIYFTMLSPFCVLDKKNPLCYILKTFPYALISTSKHIFL
jgi:hypothetical protein